MMKSDTLIFMRGPLHVEKWYSKGNTKSCVILARITQLFVLPLLYHFSTCSGPLIKIKVSDFIMGSCLSPLQFSNYQLVNACSAVYVYLSDHRGVRNQKIIKRLQNKTGLMEFPSWRSD